MCEINPRRKKFFRLELFTSSHKLSDLEWLDMIAEVLLKLEQQFNEKGEIRVHIHEAEE